MNYHNKFKTLDCPSGQLTFTCQQQFAMLIESLEFVLSKLSELCRWQSEQQGLTRKKSLLKLFDKNIDNLSSVKVESIGVPVFDEFPKIADRLEMFKTALNLNSTTDYCSSQFSQQSSQFSQQLQFEKGLVNQIGVLEERVKQLDQRTVSLEADLLEVIGLYRDVL